MLSGLRVFKQCVVTTNVYDVSTGAGAYSGCTYCCIRGEYSNTLNKIVYLEHRAFLSNIDTLTQDFENFPHKRRPLALPEPKTMSYVQKAIGSSLSSEKPGEKKKIIQDSGYKGPYALQRLSHHDRYLNTPVEPMHLIKNIGEHIVKLLSGVSDTSKVREEGTDSLRFGYPRKKKMLFHQYHLSCPKKSKILRTNSRVMSVTMPHGLDRKQKKLFCRSGFAK